MNRKKGLAFTTGHGVYVAEASVEGEDPTLPYKSRRALQPPGNVLADIDQAVAVAIHWMEGTRVVCAYQTHGIV